MFQLKLAIFAVELFALLAFPTQELQRRDVLVRRDARRIFQLERQVKELKAEVERLKPNSRPWANWKFTPYPTELPPTTDDDWIIGGGG